MKKTSLFILSIVLIGFSAKSQDFDYSFVEEYNMAELYDLFIKTSDGNIEVSPTSNDKVQVYYIVRHSNRTIDIDREALEEYVDIEVESREGELQIEVTNKDRFTNWINQYNVSFKIYVPKKTETNLRSSDGNLIVSELQGNQTLRTSDGNIRVEEIRGVVDAKTSDGNVMLDSVKGNALAVTSDGNIQLRNVVGYVDVHTSDGNIGLGNIKGGAIAITSDGNIDVDNLSGERIDARTSDGRITLNNVVANAKLKTTDGSINFQNVSGSMEAITSDGDIRGDMNVLKESLVLRTSDGSISASIPDKMGLDLKIKAENINMPRLENFSGKADDDYIQGTINDGGVLIDLSTSDGSVSLSY